MKNEKVLFLQRKLSCFLTDLSDIRETINREVKERPQVNRLISSLLDNVDEARSKAENAADEAQTAQGAADDAKDYADDAARVAEEARGEAEDLRRMIVDTQETLGLLFSGLVTMENRIKTMKLSFEEVTQNMVDQVDFETKLLRALTPLLQEYGFTLSKNIETPKEDATPNQEAQV